MTKRLDGKVAVITGAARGLGASMAQLFAENGARVIAVDMGELSYVAENVESYELDVTDTEGCKRLFMHVVDEYGKIDILVNNAGITRDALTHKMTDEMWNLVVGVNLKGVFNMTRHIGPFMAKQGMGSIVNISSIAGESGNVGQANYAATKAGVHGLTQTWAKEFAMSGAAVRVNSISPGVILTDIIKTVPEKVQMKMASITMLGRLGNPSEVANAALFLASDEASYITGHNLSVNGGLRM